MSTRSSHPGLMPLKLMDEIHNISRSSLLSHQPVRQNVGQAASQQECLCRYGINASLTACGWIQIGISPQDDNISRNDGCDDEIGALGDGKLTGGRWRPAAGHGIRNLISEWSVAGIISTLSPRIHVNRLCKPGSIHVPLHWSNNQYYYLADVNTTTVVDGARLIVT